MQIAGDSAAINRQKWRVSVKIGIRCSTFRRFIVVRSRLNRLVDVVDARWRFN
jgi:hypothetical protein